MEKIFKQIHMYTELIQRMSTIYTHKNANLLFCHKSAFYAGIRTFSSLPRSLTSLRNEKAQFKQMIFLCVKIIHNTKRGMVFCTVIILYALHTLCVLYVYDLFHIVCSDSRAAIADLAKTTTECLVWKSTEALKATNWI
jgi:hypothetical protein